MKATFKDIWRIIKKKKSDRTIREKMILSDWIYKICTPIRIIIFPVVLIVRLYKWTYNNE